MRRTPASKHYENGLNLRTLYTGPTYIIGGTNNIGLRTEMIRPNRNQKQKRRTLLLELTSLCRWIIALARCQGISSFLSKRFGVILPIAGTRSLSLILLSSSSQCFLMLNSTCDKFSLGNVANAFAKESMLSYRAPIDCGRPGVGQYRTNGEKDVHSTQSRVEPSPWCRKDSAQQPIFSY